MPIEVKEIKNMDLSEVTERLDTKLKEVEGVFAPYPGMKGIPAEVLEKARRDNAELKELQGRYTELAEAEEIRSGASEWAGKLNEPVRNIHLPAGTAGAGSPRAISLGKEFVNSAEFKAFQAGRGPKFFSVEIKDVELKTLVSTTTGYAPQVTRNGTTVPLAQRQPVVADLIPQSGTNQNTIRYMRQKSLTNNAAPVLEGGVKPESGMDWEPVDSPVEVIAHWIPVTNQQLDDVPGIQAMIEDQMIYGLQIAEENELLNGTGVPPRLKGFLTTAGVNAYAKPVGQNIADAVLQGIHLARTVGKSRPSGVILNPDETFLLRTMRVNGDGTGDYVFGGPAMGGQDTFNLWGYPVIETEAIATHEYLTGDFRQFSHISRRMGITVSITNGYMDYVVRNQQLILVEERISLEVLRPAAFTHGTALNS